MEKTTIKHWALDDRPGDKLLNGGAESLSPSELLAILIHNGTRDRNALELAQDLLRSVDNDLRRLARMGVKELVALKIKGLGKAKAITICAALELGIRRDASGKQKDTIRCSRDIAEYLRARLQYKQHEVFVAVYLNRANKVLHYEVISEGGITGTIADPRLILKKALEHNATVLILSHNHPSGNLRPSQQDQQLTRKIREAASFFDIQVADHIIVSDEGYFSFADEGLL